MINLFNIYEEQIAEIAPHLCTTASLWPNMKVCLTQFIYLYLEHAEWYTAL